jgi:hypothetical protein
VSSYSGVTCTIGRYYIKETYRQIRATKSNPVLQIPADVSDTPE